MGRTTVEIGQDERDMPNHELGKSPVNDTYGDITSRPKHERQAQLWSDEHETEKIGLRTLGDGPLAPGAAEDAAQAEAEQDGDDKEVNPGAAGWLNLLGVSPSPSHYQTALLTSSSC
jgi:hypothetical protein